MNNELTKEKSVKRRPYYGGNQQCTEENLDYFVIKLKELNESKTKMHFRQWIFKMIYLFDIID